VSRLRALKSVPNGVRCSFGTIGALRLIQDIPDVGRDSIETDRQHQRHILVCPADGKQTQNLDLPGCEVIRKRDTPLSIVQQRVDIFYQTRHSKSKRELLGLAQLLETEAPLCVCMSR
jgi:hypothetical protein